MSNVKGPIHRDEQLASAQLERVQGNVRALIALLNECPFLVGRMKRVSLTQNVSQVVTHGLGVVAAMMQVRVVDATAVVSVSVDQTKLDSKNQMRVIANGTCTADLWFYPYQAVVK